MASFIRTAYDSQSGQAQWYFLLSCRRWNGILCRHTLTCEMMHGVNHGPESGQWPCVDNRKNLHKRKSNTTSAYWKCLLLIDYGYSGRTVPIKSEQLDIPYKVLQHILPKASSESSIPPILMANGSIRNNIDGTFAWRYRKSFIIENIQVALDRHADLVPIHFTIHDIYVGTARYYADMCTE